MIVDSFEYTFRITFENSEMIEISVENSHFILLGNSKFQYDLFHNVSTWAHIMTVVTLFRTKIIQIHQIENNWKNRIQVKLTTTTNNKEEK